MLQNAYLLAKIGADTAENERDFAEILPKIGNCRPRARHPGRLRRGGEAPDVAQPGGAKLALDKPDKLKAC